MTGEGIVWHEGLRMSFREITTIEDITHIIDQSVSASDAFCADFAGTLAAQGTRRHTETVIFCNFMQIKSFLNNYHNYLTGQRDTQLSIIVGL